ncbi:MAG: hypothetical protein ACREDV_10065 [Methylocella sp.]
MTLHPSKSAALRVTILAFRQRATAAIMRSTAAIGLPARHRDRANAAGNGEALLTDLDMLALGYHVAEHCRTEAATHFAIARN